jgi:hypothetical protein
LLNTPNPATVSSMEDTRAVITASIRAEIGRAGTSGVKVAEEIGMPYRTWTKRMGCEVAFTGEELARVALHLGVPVSTLFGNEQ